MKILFDTFITTLILAAIFFAGIATGAVVSKIAVDARCSEVDANCDGKIDLQDLSIHMWRADMVVEE